VPKKETEDEVSDVFLGEKLLNEGDSVTQSVQGEDFDILAGFLEFHPDADAIKDLFLQRRSQFSAFQGSQLLANEAQGHNCRLSYFDLLVLGVLGENVDKVGPLVEGHLYCKYGRNRLFLLKFSSYVC
jgi:hypothetical protein